MLSSAWGDLMVYLLVVILGVALERAITKTHFYITKTHFRKDHFVLGRYFFLLLFPLLATVLMIYKRGLPILIIFVVFAVIGTFMEYCIGRAYKEFVGKKLWTYYRYSIGSYTSFLGMPFWGLGGVLFYLLAEVLVR